jgi:hypothetical protein
MAARTKKHRSIAASIAVHESWARTEDPTARTAHARAKSPGQLEYFERKVDPDGTMPEAERRRRAEHLRKAHFQRMALASARARRRKAS